MRNLKLSSLILLFLVCIISGCFPKLAEAPKRGAEHEFDQPLAPEKHPKPLFDKKMRKELNKKGALRNTD